MPVFKQLLPLLTAKQRARASMLAGLMLVSSVVETASIGLIIPTLALMSGGGSVGHGRLQPVLDWLGRPSHVSLMIGGMLILLALYLAKALLLAFITWKQNAFVFGVRAELSQRLFTGYMRQPWSFHLQRNSALLINILATETNQFTAGALLPAMVLLAEALMLFGICTLLVIVEPLGALMLMATLAVSVWGFQRLTRPHLLRWGRDRLYHEGLRVQQVQQGLGGAKDVKLLGREAEFLARYSAHNIGSTRVVEWQNTLQQMPRLWIEVLAVGGLAMLVLVMIGQGKPPQTVLPTLGLFAVAAFRLMPCASRIVASLQSLRFAGPVIATLAGEIAHLQEHAIAANGPPLAFNGQVTLEGVGYQYPGANAPALADVSFTIPRGVSVGLIGGSGAGKSTLVDVILGLLTPTEGHVRADGIDIQTRLRGWQDQIGYVPQTIFLTDDSLRRNVAFGLPDSQIDEEAVCRAIRAAQLDEFVSSLPEGLETRVGERGVRLSGGQRQRIGIARALYHDPQVLVLDEATSALDTATEESVMAAVNALVGRKTLIIIAHRLSTVARCNVLYRLERGRVVAQGDFQSVTREAAGSVHRA